MEVKIADQYKLFKILIDYFYLDNVEVFDEIISNPTEAIQMYHLANLYAPKQLVKYC